MMAQIEYDFHARTNRCTERAELESPGQIASARAASDGLGCQNRFTPALKGRNNDQATFVSPFQGCGIFFTRGSQGGARGYHPHRSALGFRVPPRWGNDPADSRLLSDNSLEVARLEIGKMATTLDAMLVTTPDVCGGRIRIDGTRITVHRIAALYKQGLSAEEIEETYSHLGLGQIYAALAYYHANRELIESQLAADDAQYDELKRNEDDSGTT
jgi:uncharacterized protein (DUF433 family)